ncbi:N-acetylmuramoyl-L-alanine amidase [Novispirillum sp. DQ9]|uniref:N-acetylmuramoyl-L-alanine amidase n=1 Tax=Novispirillum sp. DQ9 TaxID=3398612 RepID=UPI003C7AFF9B
MAQLGEVATMDGARGLPPVTSTTIEASKRGADGLPRRSVLAGLAGLAGTLLWAPAASAISALGVRLGDHSGFVRVVLDLSESVPFSLFTLAEPYRIVIDLPEMEWSFREQGLMGGGGLVQAVRYGLFQPGNSRIVLDLSRPAAVRKAFLLPPGDGNRWRFVLDLGDTSPAEFLRAAGPGNRIGSPDWKDLGGAPQAQEAAVQVPADPREMPANRKPVLVLDPGHGGVDPGAVGVSGVYEKNITLAAAREFRDLLAATGRYTVHLTRDRDVFLRLRDRIAVARRHSADLFVSIHADSIRNPSTRGLSVYTLSENASDSEAHLLAEGENKADIIAGIDLSHESQEVTNILIDLAQRETMNLSARMAQAMVAELKRETTLLPRSHRFAGFAVLKAPDVPSVLMEMGYLSNADEERLLRTAAYREKLGRAFVRAVDHYFEARQKASRP